MNLGSSSDGALMNKKPSVARRKRASAASSRMQAPSQARPRLREEFRDHARAAILEAAEDVLATQGLHSARMDEVARKARVAVGTIYNLIGDREALVVEILSVRHAELVSLLAAKLEELHSLPFREQVQASVVALLRYLREHSRFFLLVMESERGPACSHQRLSQDTVAEIRRLFRELIARGIKQRALRAEGRELYPAMLMGMTRELISQDLEAQFAGSLEERAAQVVEVFLHGAGAP
jgi:AcrR family transcriptional regulator